jgi:hypothetical protein
VLPGAKPAAVLALHTAGALLNWHPHIHGIFLNGGILPDGSFVELPEVDRELLEEFFPEKVFSFLLREERLEQSTIDSMKSWEHSGFNVFAGEPIAGDDENARLFLARYLKKAPLAAERLSVDESGREPMVRYVERLDALAPEEGSERSFSPLEFLAELSCHIPRVFEQTTRYFGAYSPRTRGAKRRDERFQKLLENNFEPLEHSAPRRAPSQSWARCMKLVFEVDPLHCPKCGSEMKIKSFIHSAQEIERLCEHLGLQSWRAPPPFWHQTQANEKIWLDDAGEFSQIH